MKPAILNQCDIISWGLWSMLRLIFSLMHQSFLSLSLSLCILLQKASYFPCCSWISSVFCYSFWRPYLNGSGLTLTTHSRLHFYQSILSSIFYLSVHQELPLPPTLPPPYTVSFVSKIAQKIVFYLHLATRLFLSKVPAFVLHPSLHTSLSDNTAFCLVIHPSSNTFPWTVHCPLFFFFTQQKLSVHVSCFSFSPPFSLPFSSLSYPFSSLYFFYLPSSFSAFRTLLQSSLSHPVLP